MASQENYGTLTASRLADGHAIVGLSPLDINIAKQVNILISDMGFPAERIVMYPTTGGLGCGMEYAYSIMERGRLAAGSGQDDRNAGAVRGGGQELEGQGSQGPGY